MDLARLGVHEVGLDAVAVPPEQGVGEGAVAPEDAAAVEIDEERGHRVQEPVAIRAGAQREAHQQAPVLDRVRQVFGDEDGRPPLGFSASPIAVTAGSPATSRWRRTSNSVSATPRGSSLSAYNVPSTTRKRTRWRDGPTGSSRKVNSSGGHSASGRSQGRSRSAPPLSRRRRRGNAGRAAGPRSEQLSQVGGHGRVVAEGLVQRRASGRWWAAVSSMKRAPASRPIRSASAMSARPTPRSRAPASTTRARIRMIQSSCSNRGRRAGR